MIDQGERDARLKGYFTPEGVKVEIVAEAPVVVNPVALTFAADGTLYVMEWIPAAAADVSESTVTLTYKDGTKRQANILKKPVKDLIKVLKYDEAKGIYDQARVVLQDELPSSLLLHDGWLYITCQGTVRRYRLADMAKWDAPQTPLPTRGERAGVGPKAEVIVQGFGGSGTRQVSGLSLGNDGWLYITAAAADHFAEGADGSRATVLRTGAVFRCRPDGTKLQVSSQGFSNPQGAVAFDTAANRFHIDDAGAGCRLLHLAEASDFGRRLGRGAPAGEGPRLVLGGGRSAGLLAYNDTRFPERFRGLLFYPDVARRLIRAYRVEPKGATFKVIHTFDLLKSSDSLFQPCGMVVGPDGAIYVCDQPSHQGTKHGRIYRLSWAGTKDEPAIALRGLDSWAKIGKQSGEDLIKSLSSADGSDRRRAREELARRAVHKQADAKTIVAALLKLLKASEESLPTRVIALQALHAFWSGPVSEALVELLQEPNPDLRRLAAEALALHCPAGDKDVHEALVRALSDEEPAARRAVIVAIGRIAAPGAADVLVSAFQFDDGKDECLRDGMLRAIERVGKPAVDKLLALADSGVASDWERVVTAFLACRTRPAVEALPILLKNVHLTNAHKAALLRSYMSYQLDPPISLEPVAEYLAELPRAPKGVKVSAKEATELAALVPIKLAGLEVLASGGLVQGAKAQAVLLAGLDETDPTVRVAVVKAITEARLVKARPRLLQLLQGSLSPAERSAVVAALEALKERSPAPRFETK
jgi:hypothetical protein